MRKSFVVFVLCILLIMSSVFVAGAETSGFAIVNGEQFGVDDTITYNFDISDYNQEIAGMKIYFFFDQEALELVGVSDGDIKGNTRINANKTKDGVISLSNMEMNPTLKCIEKATLSTLEFKVKAAVVTDITYFVQYLYDSEHNDIGTYTFSNSLSCNNQLIASDKTPVLESSPSSRVFPIDENGFINTKEGKNITINTNNSSNELVISKTNETNPISFGVPKRMSNGTFILFMIIPALLFVVITIIKLVVTEKTKKRKEKK